MLTAQNFEKGFLVNETLMGGISQQESGVYLAYIVDHEEGGLVYEHEFPTLDLALNALNSMEKTWAFESTKSCDSEDCGKPGGGCKGSSCKAFDECGGTRC